MGLEDQVTKDDFKDKSIKLMLDEPLRKCREIFGIAYE